MARSINQVMLMGNLTRDPEVRQTPSGQSVCSFSLALNRSYKGQNGEWQEATDYIDCVAWGPLAERVGQYLKRGSRTFVQGRLQSRTWEQQDGQKRSKVEVLASDVTFLDGRGDNGPGGGSNSFSGNAGNSTAADKPAEAPVDNIDDEPINLDDIPF